VQQIKRVFTKQQFTFKFHKRSGNTFTNLQNKTTNVHTYKCKAKAWVRVPVTIKANKLANNYLFTKQLEFVKPACIFKRCISAKFFNHFQGFTHKSLAFSILQLHINIA
jgi:hypothetical protein